MKIDVIGICDHNSAENADAAMRVADSTAVTVLPGMEITTAEEVHVLALFESASRSLTMQNIVYKHLLHAPNQPQVFGEQIIANEYDDVVRYHESLLMTATTIPLDRLVDMIHDHAGIAIASHIDRQSFGIYGQLGFIPPDLPFDAVEVSSHLSRDDAFQRFPDIQRFPITVSSDAHRLADIGTNGMYLWLENPTYAELKKALNNEDGRSIELR